MMDWERFVELRSELGASHLRYSGLIAGYPTFTLAVALRGGKGGFGKLLKSQKNIGKKTDNFDSCRDLQGRRLRNANQEEKLRKFKEQKLKEDEIVQSLQSSSASSKPVAALDEKYTNQLAQIERHKVETVVEGMRTASSTNTKPTSNAPKAKKLILFDDESISD